MAQPIGKLAVWATAGDARLNFPTSVPQFPYFAWIPLKDLLQFLSYYIMKHFVCLITLKGQGMMCGVVVGRGGMEEAQKENESENKEWKEPVNRI